MTAVARWVFSQHATKAIGDRGFFWEEVMLCLADPEVTYPQSNYGPSRNMLQRGSVAVVVDATVNVVVTVLLKTIERWAAADCKAKSAA